jgi:hypothetical protein
MRRYTLLKPMPHVKVGTIYIKAPKDVAKDNCSYYPDVVGCKNERWMIHADFVENNPEWFSDDSRANTYNSEFHNIVVVAANMDSDSYIRAFCQLPELIKQRRETARIILNNPILEQKSAAIECFEYMNKSIKQILGV